MIRNYVIGIVIVLLIVGALAYLYFSGYFYTVKVDGIRVSYQNDLLVKYIRTTYSNSTFSLHGGQVMELTLNMSSSILPTQISGISISPPFRIYSISPSIPFTIKSGSYELINITIVAPMGNYNGPISIIINGQPTL
ncbi:hypothetical protein [Acidianus sp. RZ1]|uniref:hypothetical protein n=1 Tax=Acidianus sp. RZ1 TaxID=1540082 RepID=UPI001C100D13|nr:hypothetical protein [Acidianus sp. RZ1]